MENMPSKQEEHKVEKLANLSAEENEDAKKAEIKTVISIKDVIDKHPTSKAVHDIPPDEQQHNEKK